MSVETAELIGVEGKGISGYSVIPKEYLLAEDSTLSEHISSYVLGENDLNETVVESLRTTGLILGSEIKLGSDRFHEGDAVLTGLDDLSEKLKKSRSLGLSFMTWNHKIIFNDIERIGRLTLAQTARFAYMCQQDDVTPVINVSYSIDKELINDPGYIEHYLSLFLRDLVGEMRNDHVALSKVIFVFEPIPVLGYLSDLLPEVMLRTLISSIPNEVPAVFLTSLNLNYKLLTKTLDKINKVYDNLIPWNVNFALEESAVSDISGADDFYYKLLERVKLTSLATIGNDSD